jgi:hypothetical protein
MTQPCSASDTPSADALRRIMERIDEATTYFMDNQPDDCSFPHGIILAHGTPLEDDPLLTMQRLLSNHAALAWEAKIKVIHQAFDDLIEAIRSSCPIQHYEPEVFLSIKCGLEPRRFKMQLDSITFEGRVGLDLEAFVTKVDKILRRQAGLRLSGPGILYEVPLGYTTARLKAPSAGTALARAAILNDKTFDELEMQARGRLHAYQPDLQDTAHREARAALAEVGLI